MAENPTDSAAPRVEFDSAVLQQIRRHARSSMEAEICGVLIGSHADGATRVTACIAGEKAAQGGAHVTFTQETWAHIYRIKDAQFAEQAIIGWYHSHPGFGIFLSDYDLFIHENFFAAPHQVAWVFDPHSDEEGCFGWVGKKVLPLPAISVARQHREPENKDAHDQLGTNSPEHEKSTVENTEKRSSLAGLVRIATVIFALLAAFAAGLLIGPILFPIVLREVTQHGPSMSEKSAAAPPPIPSITISVPLSTDNPAPAVPNAPPAQPDPDGTPPN